MKKHKASLHHDGTSPALLDSEACETPRVDGDDIEVPCPVLLANREMI